MTLYQRAGLPRLPNGPGIQMTSNYYESEKYANSPEGRAAMANGTSGSSSGSSSGGVGGMPVVNPTGKYSAIAPAYSGMPQIAQFAAYMPGFRDQIAQQLNAGFGGGVENMFGAIGRGNLEPVNVLKLREPISQTMANWGLRFDGQPGGYETIKGKKFNPAGYQQYGQATGIPYIDQMFGLKYMPGETIPTSVTSPPPVVPPAPAPKPKKTSTSRPSYSRDRRTGIF